jgi:hypothetical protein
VNLPPGRTEPPAAHSRAAFSRRDLLQAAAALAAALVASVAVGLLVERLAYATLAQTEDARAASERFEGREGDGG